MDKIYLNTAACGLVDDKALQPALDFYKAMQAQSSTVAENFKFNGGLQSVRKTVADFINAPVESVAFLPNFSFGINSIVQSLKGNEKVLLYRNDYPSLLEPFRINGFDITWIDSNNGFTIDIEELEHLLRAGKIDMLAISHVQWLSGFKLDIEAVGQLCKDLDVRFILDATQSIGAIEIDIAKLNADAVIASNYKWMNAGFGTGVMYMTDSFISKYTPAVGGFNSYTVQPDGKSVYVPSIHSYEPGHLNIHGLLLLEAAIKQKQEQGVAKIERHNSELTQQLLNGISGLPLSLLGPHDMSNRSSIVLIKDDGGLFEYLVKNDFIVSQREGYVRISMHFYNNASEVAAIVDTIRAFYK